MVSRQRKFLSSIALSCVIISCICSSSFSYSVNNISPKLLKRSLSSTISQLEADIQANPSLATTVSANMDPTVKSAINDVAAKSTSAGALAGVSQSEWTTIINAANAGKVTVGDIVSSGVNLPALQQASSFLPQAFQNQVETAINNMYSTTEKMTGLSSSSSSPSSGSTASGSSPSSGSTASSSSPSSGSTASSSSPSSGSTASSSSPSSGSTGSSSSPSSGSTGSSSSPSSGSTASNSNPSSGSTASGSNPSSGSTGSSSNPSSDSTDSSSSPSSTSANDGSSSSEETGSNSDSNQKASSSTTGLATPTVVDSKSSGNQDNNKDSKLSGGSIAGIIVGCIVACSLVALFLITATKKRMSHKDEKNDNASKSLSNSQLLGVPKENALYQSKNAGTLSSLSSFAPMGVNQESRPVSSTSSLSSLSNATSVPTLNLPAVMGRDQHSRLYNDFKSVSSRHPSVPVPPLVKLNSVHRDSNMSKETVVPIDVRNSTLSNEAEISHMIRCSVATESSATSSVFTKSVVSEVAPLTLSGAAADGKPYVSSLDPLPASTVWVSGPPSYALPKVRDSEAFSDRSDPEHDLRMASNKIMYENPTVLERKVRDSFMTDQSAEGDVSRWSQIVSNNQSGVSTQNKNATRNVSRIEQPKVLALKSQQ